ncbi:hypothetical protein HNQ07_004761 [Deinococcus metalli]|uniref:DRBM domain-containing protein n=1 Tax=Deinococcus metalli TaxID=1141878 RepID=A0A7W8KLK8_9DEIO|nr:putative dsRNA-binding protein [Deinococcus metalli]MBB5379246.1 hypothetical protein [Deinococcus metalli]GHF65699.1 hypothetical protein GCM10017781_46770 [Deinococcus metalli]
MNAKGDLIARLSALGLGAATFEAEASGPPHDLTFRARVLVGGHPLGAGGTGRSKKDAERAAAESALHALDGGAPDVDDAPLPPGRWPVYAAVLAQALDAAVELSGEDATLDEVRANAARLYRDLLMELGHGPEDA